MKKICLSRVLRKPTISIHENKGAEQIRSVTAKLISAFVFATQTVQFCYFLKFPASSHLLCLDSSVCVGLVKKCNVGFLMTRLIISRLNFRNNLVKKWNLILITKTNVSELSLVFFELWVRKHITMLMNN